MLQTSGVEASFTLLNQDSVQYVELDGCLDALCRESEDIL